MTVFCHEASSRLTRSRRRGRSCHAPDSSKRLRASRRWLRVSFRIVAGELPHKGSTRSARGRRGGPRSSRHPRHVLGTRRGRVDAVRPGRPRLQGPARAVLACGCGLNEAWSCRCGVRRRCRVPRKIGEYRRDGGTDLFSRRARVRRQADGGPRAADRRRAPALVPHDMRRSSCASCASCPPEPGRVAGVDRPPGMPGGAPTPTRQIAPSAAPMRRDARRAGRPTPATRRRARRNILLPLASHAAV